VPTPSQDQNTNTRILESRLETQEHRLEDLSHKMEKYDTIITDLHAIVIALKARADTNQRWLATMFTIGATIVGATLGAVATHLIH